MKSGKRRVVDVPRCLLPPHSRSHNKSTGAQTPPDASFDFDKQELPSLPAGRKVPSPISLLSRGQTMPPFRRNRAKPRREKEASAFLPIRDDEISARYIARKLRENSPPPRLRWLYGLATQYSQAMPRPGDFGRDGLALEAKRTEELRGVRAFFFPFLSQRRISRARGSRTAIFIARTKQQRAPHTKRRATATTRRYTTPGSDVTNGDDRLSRERRGAFNVAPYLMDRRRRRRGSRRRELALGVFLLRDDDGDLRDSRANAVAGSFLGLVFESYPRFYPRFFVEVKVEWQNGGWREMTPF